MLTIDISKYQKHTMQAEAIEEIASFLGYRRDSIQDDIQRYGQALDELERDGTATTEQGNPTWDFERNYTNREKEIAKLEIVNELFKALDKLM